MPSANVLTGYGPPEMLRWQEVHPLQPAAGQIRLRVRAAGVGPTDLAIRRGNLTRSRAFTGRRPRVRGSRRHRRARRRYRQRRHGRRRGRRLAAPPRRLRRVRARVRLDNQAARGELCPSRSTPASVEAAVGVLGQLGIVGGETLLILGGAGSVGIIATQLAVLRKTNVVAAANERDHHLLRELGEPQALSTEPDRAPRAVEEGMALLATGSLQMSIDTSSCYNRPPTRTDCSRAAKRTTRSYSSHREPPLTDR